MATLVSRFLCGQNSIVHWTSKLTTCPFDALLPCVCLELICESNVFCSVGCRNCYEWQCCWLTCTSLENSRGSVQRTGIARNVWLEGSKFHTTEARNNSIVGRGYPLTQNCLTGVVKSHRLWLGAPGRWSRFPATLQRLCGWAHWCDCVLDGRWNEWWLSTSGVFRMLGRRGGGAAHPF